MTELCDIHRTIDRWPGRACELWEARKKVAGLDIPNILPDLHAVFECVSNDRKLEALEKLLALYRKLSSNYTKAVQAEVH